jgi:hypothetical protein
MAGGPGFEPRLTESESAVLPLNYPPPKPLINSSFLGGFTNQGQKIYKWPCRGVLYRAIAAARLSLLRNQLEMLLTIGRDAHLILKSHVVVNHLARHADVI